MTRALAFFLGPGGPTMLKTDFVKHSFYIKESTDCLQQNSLALFEHQTRHVGRKGRTLSFAKILSF